MSIPECPQDKAWTFELTSHSFDHRGAGILNPNVPSEVPMSTIFAYCRVSTTDQCPQIQVDAIQRAYPSAVVREEKASATTINGRPVLDLLLEMVSKGDKLVVWKLDRLARNMRDLYNIVDLLEKNGAALEVLDQRIDTGTASGKAFLGMLGVFAEFETNLRRERQLAGIAKAKATGKYKGRKPSYDRNEVSKLLSEGLSHSKIAKGLGCSIKTIQRIRKEISA